MQALGAHQAGEPFHGVRVGVGEMGEQPGLGGGQRVGAGAGVLVRLDEYGPARAPQYHPGGVKAQGAGGRGEPAGRPQAGADPVAHRHGGHVGELQ
ncbi:hypothetical protein Shyhy01_31430 [Streptomyces hygroscopicus subsp. hygroscopicus]|nr:hypothetical protein Shyhy01_31430 [Streptomyces hygroscopicus subsp. hygroscopicus]